MEMTMNIYIYVYMYIYIIYIYDMFMCALIDNLHHGLDIWTVHHGLEDIDVLAAMVHLVVGLSTSPHTC